MTKDDIQKFYNFETSLHKQEVRNNPDIVSRLVADDFKEFGKSGGVADKQDVLSGLQAEEVDLEVDVTNFEAKQLSDTVVLVTYTASMLDNNNVTTVTTNRSSVWIETDGQWQMVFHQGTKVKE